MRPEVRNVLGVTLQAKEAGAEVLVFARDRDRDEGRDRDIREALMLAQRLITACPATVGVVAIEAIEAWVLAVLGERRCYRYPHPKERLRELNVGDIIAAIEGAVVDLKDIDSPSLSTWLEQAVSALGASSRSINQ